MRATAPQMGNAQEPVQTGTREAAAAASEPAHLARPIKVQDPSSPLVVASINTSIELEPTHVTTPVSRRSRSKDRLANHVILSTLPVTRAYCGCRAPGVRRWRRPRCGWWGSEDSESAALGSSCVHLCDAHPGALAHHGFRPAPPPLRGERAHETNNKQHNTKNTVPQKPNIRKNTVHTPAVEQYKEAACPQGCSRAITDQAGIPACSREESGAPLVSSPGAGRPHRLQSSPGPRAGGPAAAARCERGCKE